MRWTVVGSLLALVLAFTAEFIDEHGWAVMLGIAALILAVLSQHEK